MWLVMCVTGQYLLVSGVFPGLSLVAVDTNSSLVCRAAVSSKNFTAQVSAPVAQLKPGQWPLHLLLSWSRASGLGLSACIWNTVNKTLKLLLLRHFLGLLPDEGKAHVPPWAGWLFCSIFCASHCARWKNWFKDKIECAWGFILIFLNLFFFQITNSTEAYTVTASAVGVQVEAYNAIPNTKDLQQGKVNLHYFLSLV